MNVCMYTGSGGVYTGIGVVAKSVATLSLQSEIMAENGFSKRIITVEKTFAMIKPDAIDKADEILEIIEENGFTILQKRRVQLKPEQASEFYAEHFGKMFFPSLINYICSGSVLALVLAREDAILQWRALLGPTNTYKAKEVAPNSLRARFGTNDQCNALHGSDSTGSAEREIHFFFPDAIIEPIVKSQLASDYLTRTLMPTLQKGLTELCKAKPGDPIMWLSDWLLLNNPNKPQIQQPGNR
ncbi:nucleoside diphosphate kinase homolog 5-like [Oscarella lobularis]|uniref:nucleoside diphosphate kinase homolog 5-like n=1 Tax=Oscarella lobularis TaxID=121494 RepID=UPI00331372BB